MARNICLKMFVAQLFFGVHRNIVMLVFLGRKVESHFGGSNNDNKDVIKMAIMVQATRLRRAGFMTLGSKLCLSRKRCFWLFKWFAFGRV